MGHSFLLIEGVTESFEILQNGKNLNCLKWLKADNLMCIVAF